jgi:hypothetical protein
MTAQEKAQAGLRLLKEAVLDYLKAHQEGASGQGVRTVQVRSELGLESPDRKGQRKGNLFWGLVNLLETAGQVRGETVGRQNLLFLTTAVPHSNLPGASTEGG